MATFSENQVRQIIVANSYSLSELKPGSVNGITATKDAFSIKFTNVLGEQVKSDYIPMDNIRGVKATAFTPRVFRKDEITISNIIAGQDYILRFLFRDWGSGSPENQYFKHVGAYRAKTGDTAEDIINALMDLATKNFAREPEPLLTFSKVGTGAATKLVVTELAQEWVLGKKQGRPLNYVIQFVPIMDNGAYTPEWGQVTNIYQSNAGVGTSHISADMEYFYLGERGDQYRQVGYPYTWNTKYLVEQDAKYDMVELTFYFKGWGVNTQNSEKQLTILCKVGTDGSHTIANSIIQAINTVVTGLNAAQINPDKVLVVGGLGTAASGKITGLTTGKKYSVAVAAGTVDEAIKNVLANGTLSDSAAVALTGTEITGLVNGTRYAVTQLD